MRPPQPKYCTTWSVRTALDFVESLEPVEDLTLKQLSYKSVLLLALTSAARAHELAALDLTHTLQKANSWEFTLDTHVKTSRPGHKNIRICLQAFPENPKICVVCMMKVYVQRTKDIRTSERLLISHVSPHGAISSQSVSRWITQALHMAEVPPSLHWSLYQGCLYFSSSQCRTVSNRDYGSRRLGFIPNIEQFSHRDTSPDSFSRVVLNSNLLY